MGDEGKCLTEEEILRIKFEQSVDILKKMNWWMDAPQKMIFECGWVEENFEDLMKKKRRLKKEILENI